jgi:hypothetical protein
MKSSKTPTNPVEQLKLLRSFVSFTDNENDPHHHHPHYTETELLDCLKYSGYNVERAAELLLTGQYKARIETSMNHTVNVVGTSNNDDKKSKFFHFTTGTSPSRKITKTTSRIQSISIQHQPSTETQTQTQTPKPKAHSTTVATTAMEDKPIRVSMTPITSSTTSSIDTNTNNSIQNSIPIDDDDANLQSTKNTPTSSNECNDNTSVINDTPKGPYLLCRRWISDACITSRYVPMVQYRESFQLDYTQTGYSMIKFRSMMKHNNNNNNNPLEGRLPEHIATILIPFLRYNSNRNNNNNIVKDGNGNSGNTANQRNDPSTSPSSSSSSLIQVQIESMMEDRNLVMGSTIPIQITILIHSIEQFFHAVTESTIENSTSSSLSSSLSNSTQYIPQRNNQSNPKSIIISKRRDTILPIHKAAFLLFQWAQYGDITGMPNSIDTTTGSITNTNTNNNDNSNAKSDIALEHPNDEIDDRQQIPNNDDDENAQLMELDDEALDHGIINHDTTNPDLDIVKQSLDVICNNNTKSNDTTSHWIDTLPANEMNDPIVFRNKNVNLRPYQKQALYFMIQREWHGMTIEQINDQTNLLNELIIEQNQRNTSLSVFVRNRQDQQQQQNNNNKIEIICDCGPVIVTEEGQTKSMTYNGTTNPIQHPLWQHRFVSTLDMKHSIIIFVNELLGIVTHIPPKLPNYCSGGILADAMGLGKTVMLLALITKTKEMKREQERKNNNHSNTSTKQTKIKMDGEPNVTLVVAKLSLLPQWEDEIKSKTNLKYKIYYGSNSNNTTNNTMNADDYLQNVVRC